MSRDQTVCQLYVDKIIFIKISFYLHNFDMDPMENNRTLIVLISRKVTIPRTKKNQIEKCHFDKRNSMHSSS